MQYASLDVGCDHALLDQQVCVVALVGQNVVHRAPFVEHKTHFAALKINRATLRARLAQGPAHAPLQAAVATLGPTDNDFERKAGTVVERGQSLIAKVGHLVGVIAQAADGRAYDGPRTGESHARMLVRMQRRTHA